ncbi:PTS transporter subunit EIIC [Testudinibacter aquarius]|uniref:PTS glucose transporter subunit IIBC n=1 Tax=Testudinibacter aquarius TaxID=1524974 RepID=A0A4R3Y6I6_9PAST|nr:PTS transporter subunit EIIC [Testudinibacter aquarius]KAE9525528.1 PTS glucose transporter subunit IIBC [Testudinibacter aquarius]TCV87895.1 PTS system IIB component (Glc family) /PTS system IIC component (Glc family) [Testudinibacter aquarius]TNG89686.1 PTS glucose transporter subunit IIBC [Testudinibacter aquarius]
MKEKLTNGLQRFSKAMFVPILILPIVGVLIAFSNVLNNAKLAELLPFLDNIFIKGFGTILSSSLVSILVNLGLIFCVGLSVGLAKEKKAEAGFTAVLAYLIFTYAMNKFMLLSGILYQGESLRGTGQTMVLGIQILDMGIFLGLFLGSLVAFIHNRYCEQEFNSAFQIYGGSRFVFIILIPTVIFSAIVLTYLWPFVQYGILKLGVIINHSGEAGIFLYGMLERLLIPTGLHHLVYTSFLYTPLGGSVEINGQVFEGARNIYYAEMALPSIPRLSPTVIWDARGISKMYGLIGACFAMYYTAKPENKAKVKAILIPAAFSSFIAGVTEPIEFTFMFVAPLLFIIHAVLSGLSMVVLSLLDVRAIGPNGFIDFLLFNVPLGITKTGWPMYMLVGVIFFCLYYVIFTFLIKRLDLKTIGREDNGEEAKLYSKDDYHKRNKSTQSKNINADTIIDGLGGQQNIQSVENCYTRLRLLLKDPELVDENLLKNYTGASAVIKMGNNVQVVYGLQVNSIRKAVDHALEQLKNQI